MQVLGTSFCRSPTKFKKTRVRKISIRFLQFSTAKWAKRIIQKEKTQTDIEKNWWMSHSSISVTKSNLYFTISTLERSLHAVIIQPGFTKTFWPSWNTSNQRPFCVLCCELWDIWWPPKKKIKETSTATLNKLELKIFRTLEIYSKESVHTFCHAELFMHFTPFGGICVIIIYLYKFKTIIYPSIYASLFFIFVFVGGDIEILKILYSQQESVRDKTNVRRQNSLLPVLEIILVPSLENIVLRISDNILLPVLENIPLPTETLSTVRDKREKRTNKKVRI